MKKFILMLMLLLGVTTFAQETVATENTLTKVTQEDSTQFNQGFVDAIYESLMNADFGGVFLDYLTDEVLFISTTDESVHPDIDKEQIGGYLSNWLQSTAFIYAEMYFGEDEGFNMYRLDYTFAYIDAESGETVTDMVSFYFIEIDGVIQEVYGP